jgi:hypothetical protein
MLNFIIEKLCKRIEEFKESGEPLSMRLVYMCFIIDITTLFVVNRSWNYLDSPDFSPMWINTIQVIVKTGVLMKHFPWLLSILPRLPKSVIGLIEPGLLILDDFQNVCAYIHALNFRV